MRSIKTIVGLLLLLLPGAVMAQNGPFLNLSATPVGKGPLGVAVGDLNGDGIPDIATTNSVDGTVSIMLGNGDGSYRTPTTLTTNPSPGAIAIADLNKDGKADLIVGTTGSNSTLQVFLGNGDGTFQAPSTLDFQTEQVVAFQVADFNGDGTLDLAIANVDPDGTSVTIFLGKGDGTFAVPTSGGGPGFSGSTVFGGLVAGDFDGNGTIDLAAIATTTNPTRSIVAILSNDGKGNLTFKTYYQLNSSAQVLIAADFNGDGHLDLAVTEGSSGNVAILLGNGDGTLQTEVDYAVGQNPYYVVATDLNGDGKVDLITANLNQSSLSVLLGKGDGSFQAPVNYPALVGPSALAIADLNHDGRPDVVVSDNTQNTVQVFLDSSAGTLITGSYPLGSFPGAIAIGDFNGDGVSDIAVYNLGDDSIFIYLADGQGGFRLSKITRPCGTYYFGGSQTLVAGHFLNQKSDSLVLNCSVNGNSDAILYDVDANGNWVTVWNLGISGVTSINSGDFDGDGLADLAVYFPGTILEFEDPGVNGFGQQIGGLYSGVNTFATVVGDFNGDGRPDILMSRTSGSCLDYLNLGGGAFSNGTATPCGASGVGDFNGDGFDDILVPVNGEFSTSISNGNGTFSPGHLVSSISNVSIGPVADFDGDGVLDVAIGTPAGLRISQGALDGSFSDSGTNIPPSLGINNPVIAASGDFDGNGSPDLAVVVVDQAIGFLDVFLNKNHFSTTSTNLSAAANSAFVVGQPIILTAAVAAKNGVPTGSVVFKSNGIPISTSALVSGAAQGTLGASSTAGQVAYTAVYTGDGTFSGSRSNRFVVTVNPAHSTTTVTSSGTPKLGQSFMVTATVAPQFAGTPTGAIQFYVDGEPVASSTLAAGRATASITETTIGKHTIEANYSGDANFITSAGVLKVNVGKGASTVSLAASANPALYGNAVALTAKVTDSEGAIATGPVAFSEGSTIYGTVSLSGGSAQITLPSLALGTHKITAQYGGDTNDGTATGTISEVIQGLPTTTVVVSNTQPSFFGQNVTFTATISAANGMPDGTLSFKNGSAVLGTVTVVGGQATLGVSTLTAGTHTITALYNGGTSFAGSSGTMQQIVEKIATSTALSSSLNPAVTGSSVTFTAVVSSTAAQLPTGNVTFKDGKTTLGTVALVNGQAQLSTTLLTKGTHTITASYAASTNFTASNTALTQTIQ